MLKLKFREKRQVVTLKDALRNEQIARQQKVNMSTIRFSFDLFYF